MFLYSIDFILCLLVNQATFIQPLLDAGMFAFYRYFQYHYVHTVWKSLYLILSFSISMDMTWNEIEFPLPDRIEANKTVSQLFLICPLHLNCSYMRKRDGDIDSWEQALLKFRILRI